MNVVIDATGLYKTRKGHEVNITRVDNDHRFDIIAFRCEGWFMEKGERIRRRWHYSGKANAAKKDAFDIVEKMQ